MIARFWSAHTTRTQAPMYVEHFRSQVLPELHGLDGFASAMLLERGETDDVEIVVVTFWQMLDSIRAFSGPDVEEAIVADEAAAILNAFDRRVRHFEVIFKDGM